ncbi:unnamed protein product [Diabrotica balteata]|uniref:Uncharacterized protein n=1 Tax=Diabrotica balteata TaxID=107213 RepID=A0A9P0GY75_DIABA|nr:unnamed protein product [Diabrotica balteata]
MKFIVLFALVLYCSLEVSGLPNPACAGVQCSPPQCGLGARLKLKEGACCPTCEGFGNPRCAGIQCGVPLCPAGTVLRLKDGDCCASCQPAR